MSNLGVACGEDWVDALMRGCVDASQVSPTAKILFYAGFAGIKHDMCEAHPDRMPHTACRMPEFLANDAQTVLRQNVS